jgi:hypothetical protein
MIIFFLIVSLLFASVVVALITACVRLSESKASQARLVIELEELRLRFKDVIDLDGYKEDLSREIADLKTIYAKYQNVIDLDAFKDSLSREIASLQSQIADAQNVNKALNTQANGIRHELELYSGEQTVVDCGLYTPVYDFDISQKYKDELVEVRNEQKGMLKTETAAICSQTWTVNGDAKEGKKQTKHYMHLMLRAFNGESDSIIANVRWNNVDRMIERLEGAYQAINKLGETHSTKIQRNYFQLKLKELRLTYEYQEKLKAEKDEQRRIQEQIREEQRAQMEIERKIKDSEDEERRSRLALERAKQELQLAQGAEVAKMNGKIQALEQQLAEALVNKERAKSRAQMTRFGHVYIISNIGSFGENRFKIGMTRRLEPQERVDELGDASVPFEFDVHAMIPTDNAPEFEARLHQRFRNRSVNLINQRKEFFDVTLDEIAEAVREYNSTIEIIKVPEAKSYRQTLALRESQSAPASEKSIGQAKENQVYIYRNGEQEGPYSLEKLKERIAAGEVSVATDLMWYEGLSGWAPISQLEAQENVSLIS